ncbi:hypothetical protein PHYNN_240 [Pantoea phage Phynn]|nr:hypothetical protein PHYNN_240 [Pantoea phage Phynn]
MKTFLMHHDPVTGTEILCGFAEDAKKLIQISFDADPEKLDQEVLADATRKGYLYYTKLADRIVYHSDLEKLKGELNGFNN